MAETTGISWTQATWNPWHGCLKISPGCKHCYMYRDKLRYGQDPTIVQRSKTKFYEPLKWKEPKLIFTCSWSDWFIKQADEWRNEAWEVIRKTPQHTYQILTKRPERIKDCLPSDWGSYGYPNVHLGVSVESEEYVWRIEKLLEVDAAVRFASIEPLLGSIFLDPYLLPELSEDGSGVVNDGLDWVIVGGESGANFRPLNLDHAREIRDACLAAGVPFFFKQVGGVKPTSGGDLLDGIQWHQMPEVTP